MGRANFAVAEVEARGRGSGLVGIAARPWRIRCWPGWRARDSRATSAWPAIGRTANAKRGLPSSNSLLRVGVRFGVPGLRLSRAPERPRLGRSARGRVPRRLPPAVAHPRRARVDAEQQVALVDVLAFGELDAHQLARDLRFDLHDGRRFHGADHAHIDRHRLLRWLWPSLPGRRRPRGLKVDLAPRACRRPART